MHETCVMALLYFLIIGLIAKLIQLFSYVGKLFDLLPCTAKRVIALMTMLHWPSMFIYILTFQDIGQNDTESTF